MQTLTQINKNLEVIKKLIKLNSKIFYYKNINYFPLIKLAMFSNTGLGNKKKRNKIFHQLVSFKSTFFLINKHNKYLKKIMKTDVIFFSM